MTLEALPPQTPQPKPTGQPGPHSPQPDPVPQPPRRIALNDRPFSIHEEAPPRWEMSDIFPGMICRKPIVRMRSNAGYGYVYNHRSVVA